MYPRRCCLCKAEIVLKDVGLCATCWKGLVFITDQSCSYCGKLLEISATYCFCINKKRYINCIIVALQYNQKAMQLISSFKYYKNLKITRFLAKILWNKVISSVNTVDILVPVPLHKQRLAKRGYNQAALIAEKISQYSGLPHYNNILIRAKNNPPQIKLIQKARRENVVGIFTVHNQKRDIIYNKNIALIDDVITTGATTNECAKVLLEAGVKEVNVWGIART